MNKNETKNIKIISASMLPNLRLYVKFDNGISKYIKTEMLDFALETVEKKVGFQQMFAASVAPLTWIGDINIKDDGENIQLNNATFSAKELYEKGTTHL